MDETSLLSMLSLDRTESEASFVEEPAPVVGPNAGSSNESRSYQYEPLEAGSIRLLLLLEADKLHDDLECAILHMPLSSNPEYTALSYVWGAERDTSIIYVGDKQLSIGANLDTALRHLRRQDELLWLWVDALCINQYDVEERNHHVHQMRCIYESSKHTIVYLGDQTGDNTGVSAWNFLERNSSWALNEGKDKDYDRPSIVEDQVDFRGDLHDVYLDVLSREWFGRVWVFQEVVVSKEVSVQCGPRRISWDDFCKLVVLQNRAHDHYGLSLQQEDLFEAVRRIWQARVAFHLSKEQTSYLPTWYKEVPNLENTTTDILGMLVRARNLKASDPRDKIFALLGISTGFDWEDLGTIDYAKSTAYVYTTFAGDFLATRNDYRLLSYLNSASTVEELNERLNGWSAEKERHVGAIDRAYSVLSVADQELIRRFRKGAMPTNAVLQARSRQVQSNEALASVMLEECNSQVEYLESEISKCADAERIKLPSWVPNWQCIHLATYEPRAIIETVKPLNGPQVQVNEYRTWLSSGVLAVHGRVIGKLDRIMSSASLLGKNEATFEELKTKWQQSSIAQEHPIEAHILSMWGHFLDATTRTAEDAILGRETRMMVMSPELHRRQDFDVNLVLSKPPGSPYPGLRNSFSFLDVLDLSTCPPVPGSIEAHLVARARMTAEWSDEGGPALKIVNDRNSIIDQRRVGVYNAINGAESQCLNGGSGAPCSSDGRRSRDPTSKLALLPSTAKFLDLVVHFPGAEVPFLVRPRFTCPMLESTVEEVLTTGSLPFLDYTESYMECELVGECWINDWEEILKQERKLDFVFGIV